MLDWRVGKYQLVAEVGRGATGVVFLAIDSDLDRLVAIKQMSATLLGTASEEDRLRREAAVMAQVEHPDCVRVYDLATDSGRLYLVMEFVDGASLREVLRSHGRLTPEQALLVLWGALSGLAHVHNLGVIHRDVKPENVLVDRLGTSKLADFGLASPASIGEYGEASGSPAYMSPEQVRGEPLDAQTDVYSCGAMLYELLTGSQPFVADGALAVLRKQLQQDAPDPRGAVPGLPPGVALLVTRAMAKNPAERPSGAAAFKEELERAAHAELGAEWRRRGALAGVVGAVIAAGTASVGALSTAVSEGALGGAAVGAGATAPPAPIAAGPAVPPPGAVRAPARARRRRPHLPRSRRARVGATALVVMLLLAAMAPVLLRGKPRAASSTAALDPCLVGSWVATRSYFAFTDNDSRATTYLPGGAGTTYSVAADGSSVQDFSRAAVYVGNASGHHYTVLERGVTGGHVATSGDTITITPGAALQGAVFVADRDGVEIGQGTPVEVRAAGGSGTALKRTCSSQALEFVDGPHVTAYRRVSSVPAPTPSAAPCTLTTGNAEFSFCPSRGPRGTLVKVASKVSCLGPGVRPPASMKLPTAEVTIYGPAGTLARGDFPLDRNGQWSGNLLIDPAARAAPGTFQLGGGCYEAGAGVQNGFGIPYGPLNFVLLAPRA